MSAICCTICGERDPGVDLPVLFVDTGVLFQETLDTRDRLIERYGLNVLTLKPELTMQQQTAKYGVLYLDPDGQSRCCHMRKNEPLLTVADGYDAFISSLRRGDGGPRAGLPVLSLDPETNTLRINPLVTMSSEDLETYITQHDIDINPLPPPGLCNHRLQPLHDPSAADRTKAGRPLAAPGPLVAILRHQPDRPAARRPPEHRPAAGPDRPDSGPRDGFCNLRSCGAAGGGRVLC